MKITTNEVKHIATLSRLELTDEEIELMREQLDSILNFIDKLNEVDTTNIEPTSHVIELHNVLRDDVLSNQENTDSTLFNAPDRHESFFRVPRIID